MDATQAQAPVQPFSLFTYFDAPGATSNYWNLLEDAAAVVSNTESNCVAVRFHAGSALVQIIVELALAILTGVKKATLNAACGLLTFGAQKAFNDVKEGLFTILHAVKMAVMLPFFFLGAVTVWPNEIVNGLAKSNPSRNPPEPAKSDKLEAKIDELGVNLRTHVTAEVQKVISAHGSAASDASSDGDMEEVHHHHH